MKRHKIKKKNTKPMKRKKKKKIKGSWLSTSPLSALVNGISATAIALSISITAMILINFSLSLTINFIPVYYTNTEENDIKIIEINVDYETEYPKKILELTV